MAKFSKRLPATNNNNSRLRRHTPVIIWFSVGMVLLVVVLPSALNLPQANPTTISEYAPVPPDDNSAPPGGNLSSLGLSSSRGLGSGAGAGEDAGSLQAGGKGRRVATKKCVGKPPRQTEDPMSPPCVAHFQGDNGGATAKGVTRDEVLILVYKEGIDNAATPEPDYDKYFDLGQPQTQEERDSFGVAIWRIWQQYFNERFQTYDRFVHIWVQLGSRDHSPAARHADVADAAAKLDPFAVVAFVSENGEPYLEDWARRGKPVFCGFGSSSTTNSIGVDERFFRKYPGKIWAFRPSLHQWADQYGGFLCAQIVQHPVSFAGDGSNGRPRRIGLLGRRGDGSQNEYDFGQLIRRRIESCGGTVAAEHYVPGRAGAEAANYAAESEVQMASMLRNGVTTIVYTTGFALGYSNVVGKQPWRPEWILLEQDNVAATAVYEDQEVYRSARHFTTWPRAANASDRPCAQAEAETGRTSSFGCVTYPDALMLFTGIQVAGPRLTAESIDRGFHRIPAIPSSDPRVPACFFKTGDYTCVKDAQRQWWDPSGKAGDSSSIPNCWKSMEGGKRYLADSWPVRDLESFRSQQTDGCNRQGYDA